MTSPTPTVKTIFISYRRDDSAGHVGRLYDVLGARYGPRQIFVDIDHIGPGEDFVQVLDEAVARAGVLLVVIGKRWAGPDETGRLRLHDPNDFVRLEIAAGLQRRSIRVIPVLVQGASMPTRAELPAELHDLLVRNAIEISDARWKTDVARLVAELDRIVGDTMPTTVPLPSWAKWGGLVAAALLLMGILRAQLNPAFPTYKNPYASVPDGTPTAPPEDVPDKAHEAAEKARKWRSDAQLVEVAVRNDMLNGKPSYSVQFSFVSPVDMEGLWVTYPASGDPMYMPTNQPVRWSRGMIGDDFVDVPKAVAVAKDAGMLGAIESARLSVVNENTSRQLLVWTLQPKGGGYPYYVDAVRGTALSAGMVRE
jgi:hypothetical protein